MSSNLIFHWSVSDRLRKFSILKYFGLLLFILGSLGLVLLLFQVLPNVSSLYWTFALSFNLGLFFYFIGGSNMRSLKGYFFKIYDDHIHCNSLAGEFKIELPLNEEEYKIDGKTIFFEKGEEGTVFVFHESMQNSEIKIFQDKLEEISRS